MPIYPNPFFPFDKGFLGGALAVLEPPYPVTLLFSFVIVYHQCCLIFYISYCIYSASRYFYFSISCIYLSNCIGYSSIILSNSSQPLLNHIYYFALSLNFGLGCVCMCACMKSCNLYINSHFIFWFFWFIKLYLELVL